METNAETVWKLSDDFCIFSTLVCFALLLFDGVFAEQVKSNTWPLFRWSFDDAYFATVVKDRIQIYDAATMQLFGGAALRVPGIKTFSWSPSANVLAYYVPVPEDGNHPAGVTLMEVPSKNVVRQKNLFDVKDCRLHWHPSGAYLAVKVDRLVGSKKKSKSARVFFGKVKRAELLEEDPDMDSTQINRKVDEAWEKAPEKERAKYEAMAREDKERYAKELNFSTTFQIFRMDVKGIPVEEVEFDKKDPVVAFAWQPSGSMFAVIHGRAAKPDVSIYAVKKEGVKLLKTLEQRQANTLFWSPVNDFLVLANVKSQQGNLEFVHAGMLETITTGEHQNATEFLWEPRGRYFISAVSAWRQNVETGYQIFSFNGRLLAKVLKPKFFELHWRPRPPSLLSTKEEKSVMKKLKDAQREFEKEDELRRRLENRKFFEERLAIRGAYYKAQEEGEKEFAAAAKKHAALVEKLKRDEAVEVFEEAIEQVIDEKITVLG
jgi:translation initiation factor 3 subunit B